MSKRKEIPAPLVRQLCSELFSTYETHQMKRNLPVFSEGKEFWGFDKNKGDTSAPKETFEYSIGNVIQQSDKYKAWAEQHPDFVLNVRYHLQEYWNQCNKILGPSTILCDPQHLDAYAHFLGYKGFDDFVSQSKNQKADDRHNGATLWGFAGTTVLLLVVMLFFLDMIKPFHGLTPSVQNVPLYFVNSDGDGLWRKANLDFYRTFSPDRYWVQARGIYRDSLTGEADETKTLKGVARKRGHFMVLDLEPQYPNSETDYLGVWHAKFLIPSELPHLTDVFRNLPAFYGVGGGVSSRQELGGQYPMSTILANEVMVLNYPNAAHPDSVVIRDLAKHRRIVDTAYQTRMHLEW